MLFALGASTHGGIITHGGIDTICVGAVLQNPLIAINALACVANVMEHQWGFFKGVAAAGTAARL